MNSKRLCFDQFTFFLETFWQSEKDNLMNLKSEITNQVFRPLKPYEGRKVSKELSTSLLLASANNALNELKDICSKYSVDVWLTVIRRFPTMVLGTEWIKYASLAIIKWANWHEDTTFGQVQGDNEYGLVYAVTYETIYDCWRVAILANCLYKITIYNRNIGKGAALSVENCFPQLLIPNDVEIAIKQYEKRTPKEFILHSEGIIVNTVNHRSTEHILFLNQLLEPVPISLTKNNQTLFMMNYFMNLLDAESLRNSLLAYQDAISDQFGVTVEEIISVLSSLSLHILFTTPELNFQNSYIKYDLDINSPDNHHKIKFLFDLCQRGYLRYPETVLRQRLSEENFYPTSIKHQAKIFVDDFFNAFLLSEATRDEIDVLLLDPFPLLFTSPGNNCYIDLATVLDFIRWIISKGREWFSTQHGDRFTLTVKKIIEERTKGVSVVGFKKSFLSSVGQKTEVDLLVVKKDILYLIECKAFVKSRNYIFGDYKTVNSRVSQIAKAVRQARRSCEVVTQCLKEKDNNIKCKRVEWIVCTPTQEFLKPVNKYGYLFHKIPRVCTLEELVKFLNF